MAKYPVADIRNIAFCGHGSAGKTTLVDRILVATGMFNRPASVEEGTSICDFDDEEKQHKYSHRGQRGPFRPRRQAVPGDRHAGLSRLHRPDDRRPAGGRYGGGGHQRPVGHRGQHPAGVRRGEEGRPGTPHRAQQDGRREHRLPRPAGEHPGDVRQGVQVAERAAGPRGRFPRRGQHAPRARRRGRRPGRSGRRQPVAVGIDHRGRRGGHGALLRGHAADGRGTAAVDQAGRRRGHADSHRLRVGQDRRGAAGIAGRAGRRARPRRT